jgi:tetratricopeptide (TPR) repeat protein
MNLVVAEIFVGGKLTGSNRIIRGNMDSRERAKLLVEEAEELTATDLRAALAKLREAILVDPDYPELEDEIFLREDAIAKLDGVLEYIVVLLREGKEYNACQMLKDLPENYVIQDKSGLVKGLTENIAKVEKLIIEARGLPKKEGAKALAILEKANKLLPDYPGLKKELENYSTMSKERGAYLKGIVDALKEEEDIGKARKLLDDFKKAYPTDSSIGKCEAAIRNKDRELENKRSVRKGFIKRVAGALVVLILLGGYASYEVKMITAASGQWKEVSKLLAEKKFSRTQVGCQEVLEKLNKVRILFQGRKEELLTQVDNVLSSEVVIQGAEGKVFFEGDYIPKVYLAKAQDIKKIINDAEANFKVGSYLTAIKQYELALVEAEKIEADLAQELAAGIHLSIKDCYAGIINDRLNKAAALHATGSYDIALNKVDGAIEEASTHDITPNEDVYKEAVKLRKRIVKSKLIDLIASGDKLFSIGSYDVAINAYANAIDFAEREDLSGNKLSKKLNLLIKKSEVNALLVEGNNFFSEEEWQKAGRALKKGIELAKKYKLTGLPLVKKARGNYKKAGKMFVLAGLEKQNELARQHLEASRWDEAKTVINKAIVRAEKSGYGRDKEVAALVDKLRLGLTEADERDYIKLKKEYLQERYSSILRRAFGLGSGATFLDPEIILLSNSPKVLKFSITAMSYVKKGSQGKYSRYEVTYAYDRIRRTWGLLGKTSDSKVASDKSY